MASRSTTLEWHKQGDHDGHVSLHYALPAGVTITAVEGHLEKWNRSTEEYDDWSDYATVAAEAATALRRSGTTWVEVEGGENRGVRVTVTADPDPQPDGDDEPKPGGEYRYQIVLVVTRSDTSRPWSVPVPFRILP
jgi:hypothetical protein